MLGDLPSCTHPSKFFTFPFVALGQNHGASFTVMVLLLRRSRGTLELAQGFIHARHRCRLLPRLCGVIHIGRRALGSGWHGPRLRHTHKAVDQERSFTLSNQESCGATKVQGHQQKVSRWSSGSNKNYQGCCPITT